MHIHKPSSADYNRMALNRFWDRLDASVTWEGIDLSYYHVKPLKTKLKKVKHGRDEDFDDIDYNSRFFILPDDDSGGAPPVPEDIGQVFLDLADNDDDWGEEIQAEVAHEELIRLPLHKLCLLHQSRLLYQLHPLGQLYLVLQLPRLPPPPPPPPPRQFYLVLLKLQRLHLPLRLEGILELEAKKAYVVLFELGIHTLIPIKMHNIIIFGAFDAFDVSKALILLRYMILRP
jgi:hypothetical protein